MGSGPTNANRRTDVRPRSILLGKSIGLLSLVGLTVGLGACGGDSAAADGDGAAKAEAARVRLEQCLRSNGLNIQSGDGGRRTLVRVDGAKARLAMQKCRKYQQAAFGSITPEQRQKFEDAATKFAACMREHGVDMPDPVAGGGPGFARGVRRGSGPRTASRIDRASPTTQAAMKACESKLPRGGPGGGMRFGGPGPSP
jgi:hypothetical protein